ncbi:MAG: NACHT domain-containing protein, partial [Gammaproteobacteria bacterium]
MLGSLDLGEHLRGGRLLLLCDSLNEMPFADAHDYRVKVAGWREFVNAWPGNQVAFSCRQRDYVEPLGLPQVEIEPFDDSRVQRFLGKYLPAPLATNAWARLSKSPLLGLMRNPYYLYMLCYIVASNEAWPGNRAAMFDRFTDVLLKRETLRRHPDWPGSEPVRAALTWLAEGMQALGEGTRLLRGEALARLHERSQGPDANGATPEQVITVGLAASLLETELGAKGEELVRFYHHQIQEYFAARALLDRFRVGKPVADRWRVARTVEEMPDPGPLAPFEPLPPPPLSGWEEPTVLAAGLCRDASERDGFVSAVCALNPSLAARCLNEALANSGVPGAVSKVQEALLREMGDPEVHLRARLAAGEALGWLG